MAIFTADRATRAFIEPCDTYEEAEALIELYEAEDRVNDTYAPSSYTIVDENHKIL